MTKRKSKQEILTKCEVCGNKEFVNSQCKYCIWKGTIGPGLILKQMLAKQREDEILNTQKISSSHE